MNLSNESTRAYIYRVLIALVPILTAYGYVDSKQAPMILGLGAAVFGFGLASANTKTNG
jgi:hypothetical protein